MFCCLFINDEPILLYIRMNIYFFLNIRKKCNIILENNINNNIILF